MRFSMHTLTIPSLLVVVPLMVATTLPAEAFGATGAFPQERPLADEAREMDEAEEVDLARWAELRLSELEAAEEATGFTVELGIERLWALYFLGVVDEDRVEEAEAIQRDLMEEVEPDGDAEALVDALGGALEVARAKHAWWPPNKLKHLRAGMEVLDRRVQERPGDLGIRYLRLVSCFYLPFFLDRDESVAQDMGALAAQLPDQPQAFSPLLYRAVVLFVLQNGEITPEERSRLQEAIA